MKTATEENIVKQAYTILEKDYERTKNQLRASQDMVEDLRGREKCSNELLAQLQFSSEIENQKLKLEILFVNDELATEIKKKLAVEDQLDNLKDNAREVNWQISELHQNISRQETIKKQEIESREKVIKEKAELSVELEERSHEMEELKNELAASNGQLFSLEGQVAALQMTLIENIEKMNKKRDGGDSNAGDDSDQQHCYQLEF